MTGLWGNRTFPGPGKNRTTCAFRREPLRFPRLNKDGQRMPKWKRNPLCKESEIQ